MRSSGSGSGSGRNSGRGNPRGTGGGNPRGSGAGGSSRGSGAGGSRGGGSQPRGAGGAGGRDDRPKRAGKPRPEERRYDVGPTGSHEGPKSGRGASARGGAKGGPKQGQGTGRGRSVPATSREYDARAEERNRERYAGKKDVKLPKTFPGAEQEGERLQKVLARAGYGSRRACEELIEQSRVEVNGEIVVEQGLRVDPEHDEIKVDGLTVATQSYQFFSLNKPAGVVSTMEDNEGRQCLGDYVTNRETRLFHPRSRCPAARRGRAASHGW